MREAVQEFYGCSLLSVKALQSDKRIITGTASTPTPDRMDDIVEPLGMEFSNPIPFLWQHNAKQPIGLATLSKPTKDGVKFTAEMPILDESDPQALRDLIDMAWSMMRLKLVPAVSIGFRAIEQSYMQNGGIHFIRSEIFELSAVTIPAQAEARIETVKTFDQAVRRSIGIADLVIPEQLKELAATGKTLPVVRLGARAGAAADPFVIRRVIPLRS